MLEFAGNWHWGIKTLVAAFFMSPVTILLIFFQKRYALDPESFLLAWLLGVSVAFMLFKAVSEENNMLGLFQPLTPFLCIIVFGIILGGVANVFLSQAIPQASNPGLPWGVFSINTVLAYLLAFAVAKVFPDVFPEITFNWINFLGVIFITVGLPLVMYAPKQ